MLPQLPHRETVMRKDFERVHVTVYGPVARLTLNHPEVMNAATPAMAAGLLAALDFVAERGGDIRAIVLTGEGRGFCSGANLSEFPLDDPRFDVGSFLEYTYHPVLRRLRDLPLPLITAVNGAAAGIGMSFALMGDLIVAARSAYFLQAFTKIALVPDGGSTWLLPRLIGLARARELSLLAEKLPAEKALEWGLINRVSDDDALLDDAMKLALKLAEGPTRTYAMVRRLYWESTTSTFEDQLDRERQTQRQAGYTGDFAEGVAAFLGKRPPRFTGI
jgi:2-(1,2-epoxy-1,2-dihydrophenyl)acetyl-CoA isomerase